MSNYPEDFKSTNMDNSVPENTVTALYAIFRLPNQIEEMLNDCFQYHGVNISPAEVKASMAAIKDCLDDLTCDERHRLSEGTFINPQGHSSMSDLLFQAFKPLPNKAWGNFRPNAVLGKGDL